MIIIGLWVQKTPPLFDHLVGAREQVPRGRDDEQRLTADIARLYGRYGYRKVAALLRLAGWTINDKRVERIWQREHFTFLAYNLTRVMNIMGVQPLIRPCGISAAAEPTLVAT